MKILLATVLLAGILLVGCTQKGWEIERERSVSSEYAQELASYGICDPWKGTEVASIYSCKNSKNEQVFLEMFKCEDCGNLYFDANQRLYAICGSAMTTGVPPLECKDIKAYKCDFQNNIFKSICAGR